MRREKESSPDSEGWKRVGRRSINNRLSYSFFISGFPDGVSVDDLKMATKHLGTIDDVFMGTKRRFNKERFSFIRFKNLIDSAKVERRLNEIKLGGQPLKANLSKISRKKPWVLEKDVGPRAVKGATSCHLPPVIKSLIVEKQN
ncbi:hypothetical protein SSX86_024228 [Deinandra increscens subsp. villosa]|uniref:RRM domain-containing protein n=1 Tax=Deinandra increscens subsp. villosa TaxID=3103831 RepID=A0AAP0GQN0_9ASTR